MDRREFIKTTGTLLAGTALAAVDTAAEPEATAGRLILPMNRNWRYHPGVVEGATRFIFDDSKFESVTIPHANVRLPWHSFNDKDYEFVSTYRRRFRLPAAASGKRVFVDFEGAMTASTLCINGVALGEYKGGYTPFSFELTPHLRHGAENVLAVQLDSTQRNDIPPFGAGIDYLTFGGIYREVALRVVPNTYIDNVFAHTEDVLSGNPTLHVDCFIAGLPGADARFSLTVELRDGEKMVATGTSPIAFSGSQETAAIGGFTANAPVYASSETGTDPVRQRVTLTGFGNVRLWDLQDPHLYTVHASLLREGRPVERETCRIGFREATFTDHGFSLNGKIVKLRGLDRHQTFPFVGQAMPARVQRQDAKILRHGMRCNIVRTSHYPQSRHFLDCCDEIGLLVLEEIPGWQHIGDEAWKNVAVDNVGRMIRRDWNHPSIILWGVRINESKDDHDFYTRTNALAHQLDGTRPTGGIRNFQKSEFLEDVFTMNDFDFPLSPPNHPRYLNTEFVGHTFPTKTIDDDARHREHTLRHARIHNQLASNPQYAGGIGWCAFDYHTHSSFGAGDRICYHGVADIFREPKPAAGFYKSQCDPSEEIVLEPAFHWARADEATVFDIAVICSNCDHLKLYGREASLESNPWTLRAELDPNRKEFEHLKYPPFVLETHEHPAKWGDLRIEGYLKGENVITKTMSGLGADQKFDLKADDHSLIADGADTTRVVLRVTDEYGAIRPYANDPIVLTLEGPAQLIGDNPFSLVGGTGAIWIRAKHAQGTVVLIANHPRLGSAKLTVTLVAAAAEVV